MPGTMPYSLEKGPYLSVMEDFASTTDHMVQTLQQMRQGVPVSDNPVVASPSLDAGPYDKKARVQHVNADWFGMRQQSSGAWSAQPPFDPLTNPTTGFWLHWYGDAEAIFRATMIRGIEVALGLDHGEEIPSRPRRSWPMQFLWKCPQPWYEGWVAWQQHGKGADGGQVTVLFATPGHGEGIRNSPLLPAGAKAQPGYEVEPASSSGRNGMWVITHAYQEPRLTPTTVPTGMGAWPTVTTIGSAYRSRGPVVCVAPAEGEGGVLPDGRPFEVAP
ncbi:MAG TPA: hypothetical protein VM030_10965 [Acidimicrobiales bacterium]|nr:hypothetical protein [Acidimicrobiales bacterium]